MRENYFLKNKWAFLSSFFILMTLFKEKWYCVLLILSISFIYLKYYSVLLAILYVVSLLSLPTQSIGYVRTLNENYFLLNDTIIYAKNIPYYSYVKVSGTKEKIEKRQHTYYQPFQNKLLQDNIFYQIKKPTVEIIEEGKHFLTFLQQKIKSFDSETQSFLKHILFNLKEDEQFSYMGLCLVGFISCLQYILKLFLSQSKIRWIKFILYCILIVLYDFQFFILKVFMIHLISYLKWGIKDKLALNALVLFWIKPSSLTSPYLWILLLSEQRINIFDKLFYQCIVQSIIFNQINIIMLFFYAYIRYIAGILYCLAIITVITNISFLNVFKIISNFLKQIHIFTININIMSIVFLGICLIKNKTIRYSLFGICLILNLFHPLGEVTFINVGQGDAIFIRTPFHQQTILIDTGSPYNYQSLKNFLKAKGVYQINRLLITHLDSDHSGNIDNLQRDFKVHSVVYDFKIIEDNIHLININEKKYNNENDNSQVILFNYSDLNFLLMGDASIQVEKDLMKKYNFHFVDILKIGHHGSHTSSDELFLKNINPTLSIYSSGKNNHYNHPSPIVKERFHKLGFFTLNTADVGDITIYNFGFIHFFITSDWHIGVLLLKLF